MSHAKSRAVWLFAVYWPLILFGSIQAVQPWGLELLFGVTTMAMFFLPLAIFAPVFVLIVALQQRRWREATVAILLAAATIAAMLVYPKVNWAIRRNAAERVVIRARPLVEAIKRYEREHRAPPPSLGALVPRYIAEVPSIGLGPFQTSSTRSSSGCVSRRIRG